MPTKTISIPVDPEAARAYRAAAPADQKKMRALLSLWLRELTTAGTDDLKNLMDEVSRKAKAKGLTAEALGTLLKGA